MKTLKDAERILSALNEAIDLRLKWQVSRTQAVYLVPVVYESHRFATKRQL